MGEPNFKSMIFRPGKVLEINKMLKHGHFCNGYTFFLECQALKDFIWNKFLVKIFLKILILIPYPVKYK